jgi:hypothetical protein
MPKRLSDEILRKANIDPGRQLQELADIQLRKLVKLCAEHGCVAQTNHSDERSEQRVVDAKQLYSCLKIGKLVLVEDGKNGDRVLKLVWHDHLDRVDVVALAAVVSIQGPTVVVTVYFDGNNGKKKKP